MAATRSLANLINFFMSLKQSTFLLPLQNQGLYPQGHAYPFSNWECNGCYHTSHPSGQKLWIWHCSRSSSYGKYFPFLSTNTTQLAGGPVSRVAYRGPYHQNLRLTYQTFSEGIWVFGASPKRRWQPWVLWLVEFQERLIWFFFSVIFLR